MLYTTRPLSDRTWVRSDRERSESERFHLDRWVTVEAPLPAVRCGRIDDHEPHEWIRPRLFGAGRAVRYWCKGPSVLEGGAR